MSDSNAALRMPTFCRHNHLIQNCPICAREQHVELRPVVSPGAPRTGQVRTGAGSAPAGGRAPRSRSGAGSGRGGAGLTVRKLARGADDGYRSALVPGLKSSADAERLAEELAFAVTRLQTLASDPPGLYREVADRSGDLEERIWLAFEIAYVGPLDDQQPFATIERIRVPWSSGHPPELEGAELGPRSAHEPARGTRTIDSYRAWAGRAGSQAAAFGGEAGWSPERRFARAFERLSLPGFARGPRFDLLTTLGRLGLFELRAGALAFSGSDEVTLAAKRLLGIGDPLLLERRAADFAAASELPLEALDVGLYNWERGDRVRLGLDASAQPDEAALGTTRAALGL